MKFWWFCPTLGILSRSGDYVRGFGPSVSGILSRGFGPGNFVLHSPDQSVGSLSHRCLRVLAERRKALEAERQRELAEQETARQVEIARNRDRYMQ